MIFLPSCFPTRSLHVAIVFASCGALLFGCAAKTPSARWDAAERTRIADAFPGCELFEDEDNHAAGYGCVARSFRAYQVSPKDNHTTIARALAELNATRTLVPPLQDVTPRDPMTLAATSFDASVATYRPRAGTISPPEVMLILSPQAGPREHAFTCSLTLAPGVDTKEAIAERLNACLAGLTVLVEATR
jgi:hypothetical protein